MLFAFAKTAPALDCPGHFAPGHPPTRSSIFGHDPVASSDAVTPIRTDLVY